MTERNVLSDVLAEVWTNHAAKFLRYSGVAVVNVSLGLLTFNLCRVLFDMSWLAANIISVMIGAVPAYFMSRCWVWQRDGKISMSTEVLPFWGINLIGFLFSSLTVAVVDHWTANVLVVNFLRLSAWGVVWIFKYLVLDRYLFAPGEHHDPEPAIATG